MSNLAHQFLTGGFDRKELKDRQQLRLIAARLQKPQTNRVSVSAGWYREGNDSWKAQTHKETKPKTAVTSQRIKTVFYNPMRRLWVAQKMVDKQWVIIGHYDSKQKAIDARTAALTGKTKRDWIKSLEVAYALDT